MIEKAAVWFDRDMEVGRVVLTELEGLKTVDGDFRWRCCIFEHFPVEQQAMPSEAGELSVYGCGTGFEVGAALSIGHASDRLC